MEDYRRKIPIIPWLLLLIFARVSFIAGTKSFTSRSLDILVENPIEQVQISI